MVNYAYKAQKGFRKNLNKHIYSNESLVKLFKYLKKEHLLKFRKLGIIRIGTLYDYRTLEGTIQDKSEGCITYYCNSTNEIVELSPEEASKLFSPNILLGGMAINPKSQVKRENTVLNSFVFCTSLIHSNDLMKKWNYDSYFEITDPQEFVKKIFNELSTKYFPMQNYNFKKVSYVDTKEIAIINSNKATVINNISIDPWGGFFVKPIGKFSDEKEFRMVWVPEPEILIPKFVDLKIPELMFCCKFS